MLPLINDSDTKHIGRLGVYRHVSVVDTPKGNYVRRKTIDDDGADCPLTKGNLPSPNIDNSIPIDQGRHAKNGIITSQSSDMSGSILGPSAEFDCWLGGAI
jgi:hypothetical protein